MNTSYEDVKAEAVECAKTFGRAYVVAMYPNTQRYYAFSLTVFTETATIDDPSVIVASVDHTGIITESRWVKEQMGVTA